MSSPSGASRSLFLHCLRFDVIEAGPDGSTSRLYGGALAASTLSALLGAHVLGEDLAQGVAILLGLTGIVAFFGIVADVAFTWLDPRDVAVLHTVPVSSSRYFWARARALGVGLLLKTLSWGLVPLGLLIHRAGPLEGLAYVIVLAALLLVLAAVATSALQVVQRFVDPAHLRDAMVWLQVGLFVMGTAGWLALLTGGWSTDGLEVLASSSSPATAFASLWAALCGRELALLPAAAALGALGLSIALMALGASRYLDRLARLEAVPVRRRTRRAPVRELFERAFVRGEERAGFRLGVALLRRERTFRLQTYPLLAYPILFLSFGRGHDDGGLFSILFAHLGTLYLPLVGVFLRYSDTPRASWAQRLHGPSDFGGQWAGARKAMVYCLVFPMAGIVGVLLGLDGGVVFGLGHGLFVLGVMIWVCLMAPTPADRPPFSDSFQGGVETTEEIKRIYPLFMLVIALGLVQYAVSGAGAAPLLAVVGLGIGGYCLRRPTPPLRAIESVPADGPASGAEAHEEAAPPAPDPAPPSSFLVRLRAELRGLATLYAALALFGWCVGWMS